jgi:hypothetical protein
MNTDRFDLETALSWITVALAVLGGVSVAIALLTMPSLIGWILGVILCLGAILLWLLEWAAQR